MKRFPKKALVLFLIVALCLSCGVPVFAAGDNSTESTSKLKKNAVVDLVCGAVKDYRIAYYDITSISGDVTGVEKTSNGAKIIVDVDFSTRIKAETPDDSPYIKGIKAAIAKLTNKEDIEKATAYLNIWYAELERDHIGKEIPHSAKFCVFIPADVSNSTSGSNPASGNAIAAYLDTVSLKNAQVMYREANFLASDDVSTNGANTTDTSKTNSYEDKTMDSFALPTDEEVMQNAYNAVYSIIDSKAVIATSNRAQELDRVAARNYAIDEDNFPQNSNYSHFRKDCANFVSQCYCAGGLSEDDEWYPYTNEWANIGGSRSSHYGLSNYMQDKGIVFWVSGSNISRAFAGSIIYYQTATNGHVAIVTSNDGREMRYSAHTTDHCNEIMDQTWFSGHCDFLIPCWDSYSGVWTPQ